MEYVCGPIFYRECNAPMAKGDVVELHNHNFDHVTRVLTGCIKIEQLKPVVDLDGNPVLDANNRPIMFKDREVDMQAGLRAVVAVPAYVWHRLTALEDGSTYVCEFTLRDATGNVVQRYDGFEYGHY